MAYAGKLIPFALLFCLVRSLPSQNVSITVPNGFSKHGNDDLFCVPTKWYQIVIFFAVNYLSHAATIKSRPGQTYFHSARDFLLALAFPFSGVLRAVETFWRCSWPWENDLVKATRAGAFCVVVRNRQWTPPPPIVPQQPVERSRERGSSAPKFSDKRILSFHQSAPAVSNTKGRCFRDHHSEVFPPERHVSEEIILEYMHSRDDLKDKQPRSGLLDEAEQPASNNSHDKLERRHFDPSQPITAGVTPRKAQSCQP